MIAARLYSYLFSFPTAEVVGCISQICRGNPLGELESIKAIQSADLNEIQAQYTQLFVNSLPTLPCPPYESFYREGVLYGQSMLQVNQTYTRHGLSYVNSGEPADHISVELDYLAESADRSFLIRMREWVPQFTARVKASGTVYAKAAEELEEFLLNS
jgi:nitrate reductase assembly molybdenum cofactor insertion protein NarJ